MSRRTFDQLIVAYGKAEFDLGQSFDADATARNLARAKRDAARVELLKALRKAGLPVEAMAAG